MHHLPSHLQALDVLFSLSGPLFLSPHHLPSFLSQLGSCFLLEALLDFTQASSAACPPYHCSHSATCGFASVSPNSRDFVCSQLYLQALAYCLHTVGAHIGPPHPCPELMETIQAALLRCKLYCPRGSCQSPSRAYNRAWLVADTQECCLE